MYIKRRYLLSHIPGDIYLHLPDGSHLRYDTFQNVSVHDAGLIAGESYSPSVIIRGERFYAHYAFKTLAIARKFSDDVMAVVTQIRQEVETLPASQLSRSVQEWNGMPIAPQGEVSTVLLRHFPKRDH